MTRLSKRVRYAEKAGSFFDMNIYNKKTKDQFPVLKHFIYRRTCFTPKKHRYYTIDYDLFAKMPDGKNWGRTFLEHIAEKSWCDVEILEEMFTLAKFLNPNGDWDAVRDNISRKTQINTVIIDKIKTNG